MFKPWYKCLWWTQNKVLTCAHLWHAVNLWTGRSLAHHWGGRTELPKTSLPPPSCPRLGSCTLPKAGDHTGTTKIHKYYIWFKKKKWSVKKDKVVDLPSHANCYFQQGFRGKKHIIWTKGACCQESCGAGRLTDPWMWRADPNRVWASGGFV